jgi:tRNA (guanine-N7-)-methyltransferase
VPAREVQSAYCPESFRDSPIIEPKSLVERFDLEELFGRNAPLDVDLCCGDGSFLCALAQRMPERNFLGIERLLGRVRTAARKAATIGNMRVLRMEMSYAVRYLLPPASVETFYLLFPDPWPKRRHWQRRIANESFLRAISHVLVSGGTLCIATDHVDYFEKIKEIARANPDFTAIKCGDVDLPHAKFERKFRAQDAPIYRLELRKHSPVR